MAFSELKTSEKPVRRKKSIFFKQSSIVSTKTVDLFHKQIDRKTMGIPIHLLIRQSGPF